MVPHAARAQVAVALCAVFLSGCFGSGGGQAATGGVIGGNVRLSDCEGWRKAPPSERRTTIDDIAAFAGGPVGSGHLNGATLSDEKAYDLFEGACKPEFSKRFKLYKLYTRAAAFQDVRIPKR